MQNLIPKFRQSSVISEKPDYFSEKMKTHLSKFSYLVYIAYIVLQIKKKPFIKPNFILTTGAVLRANPIGIYLFKVSNINTGSV